MKHTMKTWLVLIWHTVKTWLLLMMIVFIGLLGTAVTFLVAISQGGSLFLLLRSYVKIT